MKYFRSLRFKLGLMSGLFISAAFLGLGYARYKVVSYRAMEIFHRNLHQDAEFFASHFRNTSRGFWWSRRGLPPGDVMMLEKLQPHYFVTDLDGNIIREDLYSGYILELLSQNVLEVVRSQSAGESTVLGRDDKLYYFVSLPIPSRGGDPEFVLHMGRALESLDIMLSESLQMYILSVPIVLALSFLVGWLLVRRSLKPFDEVAETAGRITFQNLNTQIRTDRQEPEVQKLVQAFNSMVARLNDSFEQMRRFNADVAHELRTPLAIMQGENELALRNLSQNGEIQAVLDSNLEELERLTKIVNDMLTLSQAEAGLLKIRLERLNLTPLVADLVEQVRPLAAAKELEIEMANSADVFVNGDALWIRRMLLNLLDNAIKYTRGGSRIRLGTGLQDGHAVLRVRDSGIGIDAGELPHIFERFYRGETARGRERRGVGLGLSLVKWIVEVHGGSIQARSKQGEGAEFEVKLPAEEPGAAL